MGASTENFCLSWTDFEKNVAGSFKDLRNEREFFDVTLTTMDSGTRSLQAHKVILSACSNFFKQILKQQTKLQTHPNPLIYLSGITHNDLMSVLDFMYNGEVSVAQDNLNSFLALAEELQIKGLTDIDQNNHSKPSPSKRARKSGSAKRGSQASSVAVVTSIEDGHEIVNIKIDPTDPIVSGNPAEEGLEDSYGEFIDEESGEFEEEEEDDAGAEDDARADGTSEAAKGSSEKYLITTKSDEVICSICKKKFSRMYNAKRHFIEQHEPKSKTKETFECPICHKAKFTSRRYVKDHVLKAHGISGKDFQLL